MRIVVDMQGAQSESRFRGIGRYTLSFVDALIRNKGEHEIILAFNGMLPAAVEELRTRYSSLLTSSHLVTWHGEGQISYRDGDPQRRFRAARLREAFLESLAPDLVHATSLFEGYLDDAITDWGALPDRCCVSTMVYDLIPLLNPDQYLDTNPKFSNFYHNKLADLKRASRLLAISNFARDEVLKHTAIAPENVCTISTAVDPCFEPIALTEAERQTLLRPYGIERPFLLYSGGSDERKNLRRLIQAYGGLDQTYRDAFQLVLAGRMPDAHMRELRNIANKVGLKTDDLILTGYLSDQDLIRFYNSAYLFVFPSWHEGFGLPALEAMSCGTAVIGANNTSLPEVIGDTRCLFDPFSISDIQSQLIRFMDDHKLRQEVIDHGQQRARLFSWDRTVQQALKVWQAIPKKKISPLEVSVRRDGLLSDLVSSLRTHSTTAELPRSERLKAIAAIVAQNQLAGQTRQLLIDVSEIAQRDAATGVQRVVRSYLKCLLADPPPYFSIELVYATSSTGYRYARHFQAQLCGQMLDENLEEPFIAWMRGDIFFALDMQHDVQLQHAAFLDRLYHDGVNVVFLVHDLLPLQYPDLFEHPKLRHLHSEWLKMIATKTAAICVSQATATAYRAWLSQECIQTSPHFTIDWVHNGGDLQASLPSRGMPSDAAMTLLQLKARPTFLSVGTLEPRKAQDQILDAAEVLWDEGIDCNLVFIGHGGWKYEAFIQRLTQHPELGRRLYWLKGISDEYLEHVYAHSSCLIAASLDEGFGLPIVEAARHNLPVIARDIPVFREIAGVAAIYFNGSIEGDLCCVMRRWMTRPVKDSPAIKSITWSTWQHSTDTLKRKLLNQLYVRQQLLVDVSELVRVDARTGIQRVVRSVLREWLARPPHGYRVEPVYVTEDGTYRYARSFLRAWEIEVGPGGDEAIEYGPGDIFYGLDYQPVLQAQQRDFYRHLRQQGVTTYFLVYDLLPIEMPTCFPEGYEAVFSRWLDVVVEGSGAACISSATANALVRWMQDQGRALAPTFQLGICHIGADLENSDPSHGLPVDAAELLREFAIRPTFLIVGTLEPRKGHAQALKAFDVLWQEGCDVNLVIIGKKGWMVEALATEIENHSRLGQNLFWIQSASDEFLDQIYQRSACVLVPSRGEGFGLPLIEAAHRGLPIIARDLEVFREIGGDYPIFFHGDAATDLSRVIVSWLDQRDRNGGQTRSGIKILTWKASAAGMLNFLLPHTSEKAVMMTKL